MIFVPAPSNAADKWTLPQKVLYGTYLAALAVDYGQTTYAFSQPDGTFKERNPLLGRNPSQGRINLAFAGSLVGSFAVAHFLPSKWRTPVLAGLATIEIIVISSNATLVGFRLPF